MMKLYRSACLVVVLPLLVNAQRKPSGSDWPEWRGPNRDGVSKEKNLPAQWSPSGENLAWKVAYGGRSTPIVLGDRVYLQNTAGEGVTEQERIMCFDFNTGKLLWEHRFNVYQSDVPAHRVGWASPAGDPVTGNVYAYGVGGTLLALSPAGKVLWERSLGEEIGLVTTHGGRTVSPVVDGDLVIVSGINSGWGETARAAHRFMAFDKKTGDMMWMNQPGGRPFDTTYAGPLIASANGTRLLIAGGGDGAVHAMKVQTGEPVWTFPMTKRGVNTAVVVSGDNVLVSHGEENLDTSQMGLLAAVDINSKGTVKLDQVKWKQEGFVGGYSSPVIDGDRVLQIDNGSNLFAFDAVTGKQLWQQNLGTIQKASVVQGDGKIYVGTENGKFFILKAHQDRCEILDSDQLGTEEKPESILASVAVSRGRLFLVTDSAMYAIGKKVTAPLPYEAPPSDKAPAGAAVAFVQVSPTQVMLSPGESVTLHARLFDANGRFIREGKAEWSLDKLKGTIEDGRFTAAKDAVAQAGSVKATVEGVSGAAALRVVPPLPWSEDFESLKAPPAQWVNATGKYQVRDVEGNKVLVKLSDNPFTRRARVFMGPTDWSNYTVEADIFATSKRRQMGDVGVVAQRYQLALFGTHQKIELMAWQPETKRTVSKPFQWKQDTWYRVKLRVENQPDGKTKAMGKAWLVSEPEPSAWTVEYVDPIPNRQGSPGIYADAPFELYLDNFKVTKN